MYQKNKNDRASKVVLTRDIEGNKVWSAAFKNAGIETYSFPTIAIHPNPLSSEMKLELQNLQTYDWLLFTSANGIRAFLSHIKEIQNPKNLPKIAVLTKESQNILVNEGISIHFIPSEANSECLARELPVTLKDRILLIQSSIAPTTLSEKLSERGTKVVKLPLYTTRILSDRDHVFEKLLSEGSFDLLLFASPSAVRGFLLRVPKELHELAKGVPTLALGRTTAEALTEAQFSLIHYAATSSINGIFEAMQVI